MQQAAANLLDNALKHTPTGGTVTLRAKPHFWERRVAEVAPVEERRRFRLPRPNSVEVSVTDSGAGIAPEHHQEIFEDFVRVDRNTSGMGLGLAIAKRLIQAHRGKIWVESESMRGSTFAFLLPMDQKLRAGQFGKKGKQMAVKEKILVVDDEPSIRKYLQTLLEVEGFEVEAVSCGKEAHQARQRRENGPISSFWTC